jgi:hypothetical protein
MLRAALIGTLLALSAAPAFAAEEWLVVKDGADAWAYEKSGTAKNEATGFLHARVARYHGTVQTDGDASFQFDLRRYEVDCGKAQVRQISNERMTKTGKSVAPAAPIAGKPWVPATFGWPLRVRWFACDGTGLGGAVKSPSKAAAMVAMMGFGPKLSEIGPSASPASAKPAATPKPAATAPATVAAPSILDDKLCRDIRSILGKGQQETPAFNSFYANEAERQKYAGLGSTPIDGFGECKIQRSAFVAGKPGKFFGMYYCTKAGLSEAEAKTFAAAISKRVGTCLQVGTLVEGDEFGAVIKSYDHSLTMAGFPRVRVVHEKDHRVVINLDSPGK